MADSGAATGGTPGAGGTPDAAGAGDDDKVKAAAGNAGREAGAGKSDGKSDEGQQQDTGKDDYAELRTSLDSERKTRKELEKRLKAIEEKDLPEAERVAREQAEVKAENQTLRSENQKLKGQMAVYAEAGKLGFADPVDAFRLIDIEFDDEGQPKGVTQALSKLLLHDEQVARVEDAHDVVDLLLEAKPYLRSGPARATTGGSADGGNSNGQPSGGNSMNDLIRSAAGRG